MMPVMLRPGVATDAGFVLNSWLKSFFRERCSFTPWKQLTEREYFDGHEAMIKSVIVRSQTLVACNPDDEDQIYGWLCYGRPRDRVLVLHYVYVKQPMRGFGIGRQLFDGVWSEDQRTYATHWTRRLAEAHADAKHQIDINPYWLWPQEAA